MEGGGAPRAIPEGMGVALLGSMGRAIAGAEGGAMLTGAMGGAGGGPMPIGALGEATGIIPETLGSTGVSEVVNGVDTKN